jgi:hypothetical protein
MSFDGRENVIRSVNDLMVIETHDSKALSLHERIAPHVVSPTLIGFMTVTIHLDHNSGGKPGEISDIRTDRRLAPKARAKRPEVAEHIPHGSFGFGQFAPKPSGASSCPGIDIGMRHANSFLEKRQDLADTLM